MSEVITIYIKLMKYKKMHYEQCLAIYHLHLAKIRINKNK